ncbi:SBBP repeat-containing protein [Synechocystis salina LEGE 06099]|uniref:SBBP repeat-containing protein n=1 Tax=Synechocystis salina TaxID=945780 RepID=UPI0018825DCE|nr:SBBP repeat-containing protein [Synechocystis salina]MBE9202675.1 SBBP repeat-containing protein [Synechocystis salina LEGE 06099]
MDNDIQSEGLNEFMYVSLFTLNPDEFSPDNAENHRIQLYGSLDNYYFVPTTVVIDGSALDPSLPSIPVPGTEIYYKTGQVFADLIAIVPFQDPNDPNLISAWIDFEGYLPPEQADLSGQTANPLLSGSPLLQLGYEGIDMGTATALAPDGDIYVAGSTSSLLGPFPRGGSDNFIARYNDDGSLEWIVQFGSTEFDIITDIVSDSAGNVYATGWTRGNVETGFGLAPGVQDNWVAKFDANGSQLWVEQFTIDGYLDRSMGIALDEVNGRIHLTGHSNTDGSVADTNDPAIVPNGNVVTWIAGFDANTGAEDYRNVFEVAQTSNSRGRIDEGFGIDVDDAGNVFSTGWAGENAYDVYLVKSDTDGAVLWTKSFGTGSNATQSYAWDVASDGTNAYILGWTQGELNTFRDQIPPTDEFAGNATAPLTPQNAYQGGTFDAFVAAYDTDGTELWTWHVGGTGDDGPSSVKLSLLGTLFTPQAIPMALLAP